MLEAPKPLKNIKINYSMSPSNNATANFYDFLEDQTFHLKALNDGYERRREEFEDIKNKFNDKIAQKILQHVAPNYRLPDPKVIESYLTNNEREFDLTFQEIIMKLRGKYLVDQGLYKPSEISPQLIRDHFMRSTLDEDLFQCFTQEYLDSLDIPSIKELNKAKGYILCKPIE